MNENRYHAPLTEKTEYELLAAIRKNAQDSAQCRKELNRRGFEDAAIDRATSQR